MAWQTFWLEDTGTMLVGLRRYRSPEGGQYDCAGGWHEAIVWLDEQRPVVRDQRGFIDQSRLLVPRSDPRWPATCDRGCGYEFDTEDEWQSWQAPLYRRTDNLQYRVLHPTMCPPGVPTAEPGAMWDAVWSERRGPDGISLMVRCPSPGADSGRSNDWPVDGYDVDGGTGWSRTGDPRQGNVTAHPSIQIGEPGQPDSYHGFLRDGVLTDPL